MRRIPWLVLGAVLVLLGLRLAVRLEPLISVLPGCSFRHLTGVACATCGLTRCALALGRWDWPAAFHWYPAAAAVVALLPVVVGWDLRRAWRGDAYPGLLDSRVARLSVWLLLVAVWAVQVLRGI